MFLHWSLDPELIQQTLPAGLKVDTFEGRAWIGVVPFFMSGVRPRFMPSVSGISNFQELNLRTYVTDDYGRAGVWFYSLDTSHRVPVWIARRFFHLNYVYARMRADRSSQLVEYASSRVVEGDAGEEQRFEWSRVGQVRTATVGSLEHFLVERYRLFSCNHSSGQLYTGTLSHSPYQLQDVALKCYSKQLFNLNGFDAPDGAPESIVASAGTQVCIHPLR